MATPFAAPSLNVPFVEAPSVTIDGALDEAVWSKAAQTTPFVGAKSGQPEKGAVSGVVRVFWDAKFLYLGVEIADRTITGGFPKDAIDPHLWDKDTFEVMLDPDGGDNRDYYELQINPQGLVFDSQFDDYNAPRTLPAGPFGHQDWSSGVERAVHLRGTIDDDKDVDDGYTIEAKIAFEVFSKAKRPKPEPGDTWKMNFYAMENNGGTAWSPILGPGNFHTVKHFGDVTFVK